MKTTEQHEFDSEKEADAFILGLETACSSCVKNVKKIQLENNKWEVSLTYEENY
jgi:hypothetical protein